MNECKYKVYRLTFLSENPDLTSPLGEFLKYEYADLFIAAMIRSEGGRYGIFAIINDELVRLDEGD